MYVSTLRLHGAHGIDDARFQKAGAASISNGLDRMVLLLHRLVGAAEPLSSRRCIMSVIGWIVFGLVVGLVAKFLMPGRDPGGFMITILLGIGGALVGGYIGRGLGWYGEGDPVGFVMAVIGAILLLFLYRRFFVSSRTT
jgi:uncharacterized membrane protein YeaQ/YmgE (transglycosylase-associated protein family)